jgi:hypothetical protein
MSYPLEQAGNARRELGAGRRGKIALLRANGQ